MLGRVFFHLVALEVCVGVNIRRKLKKWTTDIREESRREKKTGACCYMLRKKLIDGR
jgi:hypothetical protein